MTVPGTRQMCIYNLFINSSHSFGQFLDTQPITHSWAHLSSVQENDVMKSHVSRFGINEGYYVTGKSYVSEIDITLCVSLILSVISSHHARTSQYSHHICRRENSFTKFQFSKKWLSLVKFIRISEFTINKRIYLIFLYFDIWSRVAC